MQTLDVDFITQIANLFMTHKWITATIALILVVGRVFKGDLAIPLIAPYLAKIPSRARVWIVIGLGLVSAVLQRIVEGVRWSDAIVGGLAAAAVAVLTHQAVIESVRDGREIGAKTDTDKPDNDPGKIIGGAGLICLLIALSSARFAIGCSWFDKNASTVSNASCAVIDTLNKACAILRFKDSAGAIHEETVTPEELEAFGHALSAKRQQSTPATSSSATVPR